MVSRLPEQGNLAPITDPTYGPPVRVDMGPDLTGVSRVTRIGVWHGDLDPGYVPLPTYPDLFTGFIVYYQRNGVPDSFELGGRDHVWGHGKNKPIQLEPIDLSPDEYITTVRGFYDIAIWQFGFETNLRRGLRLYGEKGTNDPNPMKPLYFEAGPGNQIIGFYGSYIPKAGPISLGVYIKPVNAPPTLPPIGPPPIPGSSPIQPSIVIGWNGNVVGNNSGNIGTNSGNIGTNKGNVGGKNSGNIGTNKGNVGGKNSGNIGTNKGNIGTNKGNVGGTNSGNIGTNKGNVGGTNSGNIGTNKGNVVGKNKGNVGGTNSGNIGTNKGNVGGTNSGNIGTNKGNVVGKNKGNVVGKNSGNIGTNKGNMVIGTNNGTVG